MQKGGIVYRKNGGVCIYSLTEPVTRLLYIDFWRHRKITRDGMIQMMMPAKMISHFAPYGPMKRYSAVDTTARSWLGM